MGRACSVCAREDREDLERRLVAEEPIRAIARQTGLGRDALSRHAAMHLPSTLVAVREAGRDLKAAHVLDRLEELFARGQAVLEQASGEGRHTVSLAAIRELRGIVELIARITGELDDRPQATVNVLITSEWLQLRTVLLGALRDFPEARAAVVEALAPLGAAS